MKHLSIGLAAIAVLAVSPSLRAQPQQPPSTAPAHVQSTNRMPAGGKVISDRGMPSAVERAHMRHHAARHHTVQTARSATDHSANQLNQQERSSLPSSNPTTMNRMSVGGKPTSGGTGQ